MFFHLVHVLHTHSEEESLKKETVENIRYFDMQKLSSWGYNMERKLKTYQIHLKVNGPVFVGDGNEIQKKEYMFLNRNTIGVIDGAKFYMIQEKT